MASKILANWLVVLAEHYGREITEANAKVYQAGLAELSAEELDACCKAALRECRFMPTVADILAHAKRSGKVAAELDCDAEWLEILEKIPFYDAYYDKPGFNGWGISGAPRLTDAGKYAVDFCGGFAAIHDTGAEFLPQLRKQFQHGYERFTAGGGRKALPDGATERSEKLIAMPENVRELVAEVGSKGEMK